MTVLAASRTESPLDKLLRRVSEVSSLPRIAQRVMEVANNPAAGAADLKAVLEIDAALSARVLRCVNSSAYGLRMKISSLQQAVAYLGLKQIRNLAMTAGIAELFKSEQSLGSYSRAGLWKHLVAVGVCGRMIAMRLRMLNFEDVFLAGLLHDLGIILEDQYAHNGFVRVIEALEKSGHAGPRLTLPEAERAELGFDHATLGEEIGRRWGFAEPILAALAWHHCAALCRGDDQVVKLVQCVEVANLICTFKGIPSVGLKLVTGSQSTLGSLGLTREDVLVMAADLDREMASHAGLFDIAQP